MNNLTVSIKNINISVSFKPSKTLVNNNYQHIKYTSNNVSLITKFINLYKKFIKR